MKTIEDIPKYNVQGGTNGLTVQGDTWPGMAVLVEEELTPGVWTPVNLTGAVIRCDFVLQGSTVRSFTSAGGGIVITDAAAGEFEFSVINSLDLPTGVLHGNLHITLGSGIGYTYCQFLWPIYSKA